MITVRAVTPRRLAVLAALFGALFTIGLAGCVHEPAPAPPPVPPASPETDAPPASKTRSEELASARDAGQDPAQAAGRAERAIADVADIQYAEQAAVRGMASSARVPPYRHLPTPQVVAPSTEAWPEWDAGGVRRVDDDPVSTFSMDVDTAAYTVVRRFLDAGERPPGDAVRTEELINYFRYDHPRPAPGDGFALHAQIAPSPAHPDRHLLMLGLQAERPVAVTERARNLVLLVDTSGSMNAPDKLPLLRRALGLLVDQLDAEDRIAIVTYAGHAGIALEATPGDRRARIRAALDALGAGGSTHGSAGLATAYALAREAWIDGGINRVVLATDGDFNVGTTDLDDLEALVAAERRSGIGLTVLGFGRGNYDDAIAQRLAQSGDGVAAYVDGLAEARRVLVDDLDAQLSTVARDARIQVEFNPARVAEYRLVGYETRAMAREDFEDDAVDAGDVGAGHQVTALYELALVGSAGTRVPPLRYGTAAPDPGHRTSELAHVRVRWLAPRDGAGEAGRIERAIVDGDVVDALDAADPDLRFAAAVAGFGEVLRGGRHGGDLDLAGVAALARDARGEDPHGERGAFLQLVRTAALLVEPRLAGTTPTADVASPGVASPGVASP